MIETCLNCRHWTLFEERKGECRRFPPTLFSDGKSYFPLTDEEISCGEWNESSDERISYDERLRG